MARMMFGGGPEDVYLVNDEEGDLRGGGGATVLFYSAESGSNTITDLLDVNLSPVVSRVTSNGSDGRAAGQIAPFWGPDGVYEMWASANGSPRFLMQASNLGAVLGPIRDQYLQHAAQSNGHGTRVRDLTDVSSTAPTDGQTLVWNASGGVYAPGTVSGGGGGGTGDVTTTTNQTISGQKTFSGAQTFTGGLTARPALASGQARVLQALVSQTGNVEEWRDSTGAVKAWMTSTFTLRAPNLARSIAFAKAGAVAVGTGTYRWYNDSGVTLSILSARVNVGTASTSGTPTVDINKNGTTIYGTQANRPTVSVGSFTSGKNTGFTVTTLADGDYLTADIDVAGTNTADLVVQIEVA